MKAHAAFPHLENIQRMRQIPLRFVKQHIAQPPAQNHAQDARQQQVFHIGRAPQALFDQPCIGLLAQAHAPQQNKQDEGGQIAQAIPVNGQRAEANGYGVKLGVNQHGLCASFSKNQLLYARVGAQQADMGFLVGKHAYGDYARPLVDGAFKRQRIGDA